MKINEHIDYINKLICFVFDNEQKFKEKLLKNRYNVGEIMLHEFYLASERCRIVLSLDKGGHVVDTVRTADVVGWYDESLK